MPRRASSGVKPGPILAIVAVVVVAFLAGKSLLSGRGAEQLDGASLDLRAMTENANSLRGNAYVVEGKVDEKLRWTPDQGQVVSLQVEDGAESGFVAIRIPAELSTVNIEREQQYAFRVRFRQGGVAVAEEIARR